MDDTNGQQTLCYYSISTILSISMIMYYLGLSRTEGTRIRNQNKCVTFFAENNVFDAGFHFVICIGKVVNL